MPRNKPRRMTNARAVMVLGLVVLLAGSGCAHRRAWRDLGRWEKGLKLSVSASSLQAGKSVPFELRLSNRSGRSIDNACLGIGRMVVLMFDKPVEGHSSAGHGQGIDHPVCQQRLSLPPDGQFAWTETIDIPEGAAGPARWFIQVQIVSPRHCDVYGCDARWLTISEQTSIE